MFSTSVLCASRKIMRYVWQFSQEKHYTKFASHQIDKSNSNAIEYTLRETERKKMNEASR